MTAWAGFWIGCGLVVIGVGMIHIGDSIEIAARIVADCFCVDDDDNNEVSENE